MIQSIKDFLAEKLDLFKMKIGNKITYKDVEMY